jgi:hypothetical protein
MPKAVRLHRLVVALIHLLTTRRADPKSFGRFFGVLQWTLLQDGPLLSTCGHVYRFIDHEDARERELPGGVARDLQLISCLFFGLVVDLRAPWTPFFCATDGAESYGYGGAEARCSPDATRELASKARSWPHAFFPTDAPAAEVDGWDFGDAHRLPVPSTAFRTTFSVKCKHKFHASKLEFGALCMGLRTTARRVRWHGSRTFALVDAQAVLHAAKKGRSSAGNFWYGSRALASLLLACDIQLHVGYVPGTWNPADRPSRGRDSAGVRCYTRARLSASGKSRIVRSSLDKYVHSIRRACRRLKECGHLSDSELAPSWSSSDSGSRTGQPSR